MRETTEIFNQFVEFHGNDWLNITEIFGNVDGLLLSVCSAWSGDPIIVYDKEKEFTYFPYVRCYLSPALKMNPIKRWALQTLIKSKVPKETKIDIWFKNPLVK